MSAFVNQLSERIGRLSQELLIGGTFFSGAVSLLVPAAGNHLKIYKICYEGFAGNTNSPEVFLSDGEFVVPFPPPVMFTASPGEEGQIDFGGHYWKVTDSLQASRNNFDDTVNVAVFYREDPN